MTKANNEPHDAKRTEMPANGKNGKPGKFSGHIRVVDGVKLYRVFNAEGRPVWVSIPESE